MYPLAVAVSGTHQCQNNDNTLWRPYQRRDWTTWSLCFRAITLLMEDRERKRNCSGLKQIHQDGNMNLVLLQSQIPDSQRAQQIMLRDEGQLDWVTLSESQCNLLRPLSMTPVHVSTSVRFDSIHEAKAEIMASLKE